jgi:hypothetical protein
LPVHVSALDAVPTSILDRWKATRRNGTPNVPLADAERRRRFSRGHRLVHHLGVFRLRYSVRILTRHSGSKNEIDVRQPVCAEHLTSTNDDHAHASNVIVDVA